MLNIDKVDKIWECLEQSKKDMAPQVKKLDFLKRLLGYRNNKFGVEQIKSMIREDFVETNENTIRLTNLLLKMQGAIDLINNSGEQIESCLDLDAAIQAQINPTVIPFELADYDVVNRRSTYPMQKVLCLGHVLSGTYYIDKSYKSITVENDFSKNLCFLREIDAVMFLQETAELLGSKSSALQAFSKLAFGYLLRCITMDKLAVPIVLLDSTFIRSETETELRLCEFEPVIKVKEVEKEKEITVRYTGVEPYKIHGYSSVTCNFKDVTVPVQLAILRGSV